MRIPATLAGIALGLVAGALAASKDVIAKRFPTLGIIITVVTPVVTFIFELLLKAVWPEFYRKKIAGAIYAAWRWLLNESFRLQLTYSLRFKGHHQLDANSVADVLAARGNSEPSIAFMGDNYVHLEYKSAPLRLVVSWSLDVADDCSLDPPDDETAFVITLEPDVRELVIRKAQRDADAIAQRLDVVGDKVSEMIRNSSPLRLMTSCAWLQSATPLAGAVAKDEVDEISRAKVIRGDGWVQVTGEKPLILSATIRYVRMLEPPR